jgi:hypothetical protein
MESRERMSDRSDDVEVPIEFGAPRLLVQPLSLGPHLERWRFRETIEATTPDPQVFDSLLSGHPGAISQCVTRAARRLKSGGRLVIGYRNRQMAGRPIAIASSTEPERLLAAMLFPLSAHDLVVIANAVLYPPDSQE